MKVALILACILACCGAPADAAQCHGSDWQLKSPTVCSRLFEFNGVCGKTNYPAYSPDVVFAVGPWEQTPIRIFAISGDATVRASWRAVVARMVLGNSFNSDPMTPFVNAAGGIMDLSGRVAVPLHAEQHFSTGMQFSGPTASPLVPHLDVHLICEPAGASYFGSMTVWYALDP